MREEGDVLVGRWSRIILCTMCQLNCQRFYWDDLGNILVEVDAEAGMMVQVFEIYELSDTHKDSGAGWLMLSCVDPCSLWVDNTRLTVIPRQLIASVRTRGLWW